MRRDVFKVPIQQVLQREMMPPILFPRKTKPYLDQHKVEFAGLLAVPLGYDADDFVFTFNTMTCVWMHAWHAEYSPELGCIAAFEKERCVGRARAPVARRCARPQLPTSPPLLPPSRSARKVLDNDIANILNVSFRQNLQRLSAFSCSIEAHLTINNDTYGEFDAAWGAATIEHYQAWLMDPEACPTTWPTLLRICRENPQF